MEDPREWEKNENNIDSEDDYEEYSEEDDDEEYSEEDDDATAMYDTHCEERYTRQLIRNTYGVFLNNLYKNSIPLQNWNYDDFQNNFLKYILKFKKLTAELENEINVDERLSILVNLINSISKAIIKIENIFDLLQDADEDSDNEKLKRKLLKKIRHYLSKYLLQPIYETAQSIGMRLIPPALHFVEISNLTQQGLPEPQQKLETTLADVARIAKTELDRLKRIAPETGKLLGEIVWTMKRIFNVMNQFYEEGNTCNIMNELGEAWNKLHKDMYKGVKPEKRVLQTNLPHISMLTERIVVVANARPSSTCPYSLKDDGLDDANSPSPAWDRARRKMRPSTMAALSPIVPIDAILKPVCDMGSVSDHDTQFSGLIWILSMSEQSYYDNTLLTISYKLQRKGSEEMEQLRMLLRHNFVVRNKRFLTEHWVNVVKMGAGSFGDVVKVTERFTGRSLAVKILRKEENESTYWQISFIVTYLMERNHLVRARDSPFVVQFHESLAMSDPAVLLLVFEVCVGDLEHVLRPFTETTSNRLHMLSKLWKNQKNIIPDNFDALNHKFHFDVSEMMLVYVFEMFCALDYLAKCNIVHKDLIPSNIMISQNFHVKVADFGIANNLFYIHADSKLEMLGSDELHIVDEKNARVRHDGTCNYMDIEFLTLDIMNSSPNSVDFIFTSPNLIVKELLPADPNFLLDLWAVGVVAIECLIPGAVLFEVPSDEILDQFNVNRTEDFEMYLLQVTMLDHHYQRFIRNGLINAGGPEMTELMEFLSSIFLPRQLRAQGFLAKKNVRTFSGGFETFMAIDIEKVEAISSFRERGYTHHNVFALPMDENIGRLFQKKEHKIEYETFGEYLKTQKSDNQEFLRIQPGFNLAVN